MERIEIFSKEERRSMNINYDKNKYDLLYKVVRVDYNKDTDELLFSSFVNCPASSVEYRLGEITRPKFHNSYLFCFDTLQNAVSFININSHSILFTRDQLELDREDTVRKIKISNNYSYNVLILKGVSRKNKCIKEGFERYPKYVPSYTKMIALIYNYNKSMMTKLIKDYWKEVCCKDGVKIIDAKFTAMTRMHNGTVLTKDFKPLEIV
jgi:uncharacterized protein YqkB